MLKGMLQSPRLKYHVQTIYIDPSLSKNNIYEHKCLENIKKLYKQAGKCDEQQQFKYIVQDAMVSTPEGFTNNSPISPKTSTPVKKPSAQKSLYMFTNVLDVKKRTATRLFVATKSNCKTIKSGTTPWALKPKQKGKFKNQ